ncbi:MAG: aminoglycoside 6'-N-acetyltransferase [Aristaeellaceae bacterium]
MTIRQAHPSDTSLLAHLASRLWPHHTPSELEPEFAALTASPEAACFLAYDGDIPIGFAQCQLRHDYVEGTSTSPVGFLEGLWVEASHQRQGVATDLVHACEDWARGMGCSEFGSDCELGNDVSLAFHLAAGFTEVQRTIWFVKQL